MNDEIKEILENIKKCCDVMKDQNFVVYQKQDILKLLDYITNLQQEKDSFEKIANQNYKVALNVLDKLQELKGSDKE